MTVAWNDAMNDIVEEVNENKVRVVLINKFMRDSFGDIQTVARIEQTIEVCHPIVII